MQRLLVVCRHAESNEPYPLQPDFERELTKHGIHQAHTTGQWIRENYQKVDALLASPALRASTTARLIAAKLYFDEQKINYEPQLYNARENFLISALSLLPDSVTRVLLVGHNPGVTRLARTLTDQHIGYLEPAAAICIKLDLASWEEIHLNAGTIDKHFEEA